MIQTILKEIEELGCVVTCEGDKLKLHDPRPLTHEHKVNLKAVKADVLELFEQQEQAKRKGWIVYPFGEAYEKRVGRNSLVYIFLEKNGTYTVWRGTWREKDYPEKEKVVIRGADFATAFERANSYVNWFKK
jgi:hypothetical protein